MKRKGCVDLFPAWILALMLLVTPVLLAQQTLPNTDVLQGPYVVLLNDDVTDPEAEAERLLDGNGELTFVYQHGFLGFAADGLTAVQAAQIGSDPAVMAIEEDVDYSVSSAGSQFRPPWGLDRVDQRRLFPNLLYFYDHLGTGTHAYILDSGIRTTHEDFGGRARWGVDCTGSGAVDGHGHGTGMASIVGGTTYGVAKDANLVAVKVLDNSGTGSLAEVLCGMSWTVFDSYVLGNQPAVANLALIGPPSFILDFAVEASQLFGIQYNVAAGNSAASACNFSPARVGAAMTVAASNLDVANVLDVKASFSNFGTCVDLFAPGVNIPAASNSSDTESTVLTGTSAATAHSTGVAAAWLEANPTLIPADLKNQILTTATTGQIHDPMGSPNRLLYKKEVPSPSITQATARQRVHEFVTLSGSGFGAFSSGPSRLLFWNLSPTPFRARTPYVWRDDFIQARVPPGNLIGNSTPTPTPIPKNPIFMAVVNADGDVSNLVPFQVITATGNLSFSELTANLGVPNTETIIDNDLRRTKDGEVGDINGDGYPDLLDSNSTNIRNRHHSLVRFNDFPTLGTKTFSAFELEPNDSGDVGTYLTTILPPDGTYIEDGTTYDSDLVDLNNDGLPDVVQALRDQLANPAPCPANGITQLVRVLMNNHPTPGFFQEASSSWFGTSTFPGAADDVDHWDLDHNGFVDIGVSYRFRSAGGTGDIFLNQGGTSFDSGIRLTLGDITPPASAHDILFLDANDDGFGDVILINENGNSELFVNDPQDPPLPPEFPSRGEIPFAGALTGVVADFNLDGLDDFVLARDVATIFFNDPSNPGTFTRANSLDLPEPVYWMYDLEAGDLDLDGSVDIIAAALAGAPGAEKDADKAARVWLNDGTGTSFTHATAGGASVLLPNIGPYERLSADLIDLELDGDLDLYLTGADSQDADEAPDTGCFNPAFGRVPNQLWENELIP